MGYSNALPTKNPYLPALVSSSRIKALTISFMSSPCGWLSPKLERKRAIISAFMLCPALRAASLTIW